jgi:outer membrane protein TolC
MQVLIRPLGRFSAPILSCLVTSIFTLAILCKPSECLAIVTSSLKSYLADATQIAPAFQQFRNARKIANLEYEAVASDFATSLSLSSGLSRYNVLGNDLKTDSFFTESSLTQSFPLGVDAKFSFDSLFPGPGNSSGSQTVSWNLEVSESLWPNLLGRADRQARQQKNHLRRASLLETEGKALSLCQNLTTQFGSLYFLQEQLRLESEQITAAKDLLRWADRSYRERRRQETDLNNAKKTMLVLESQLQTDIEKLEVNRRRLHEFVSFEFEAAMDPRLDMEDLVSKLAEGEQAYFSHTLEVAKENQEAARAAFKLAQNAANPSVKLVGSLAEDHPQGSYAVGSSADRTLQVGVALVYPLFDPGLDSAYRSARLNHESALLKTRELSSESANTWQAQVAKRKRLQDESRRQQEIVRLATIEEKTAQRRLRNGQIDFLNYGLQWNQKIQAQSDWLKAQEELFQSEVWLLGATRKLDALCFEKSEGKN